MYNLFPEGSFFRESAYADVVGNSVKAISVSYRILRIHGIRRVEMTLFGGKKHTIKIKE